MHSFRLLLKLLTCTLIACAACSKPAPTEPAYDKAALDASIEKSKQMRERIEKYGAEDKEAWRFAEETLLHPDATVALTGALTLREIVDQNPKLRGQALALLRKTAVECPADGKIASLQAYWQMAGPGGKSLFRRPSKFIYQPESIDQVGVRFDDIKRRGTLSRDDRRVVLKAIAAEDERGMFEALMILIKASSLEPDDKGWAHRVASQEAQLSSGERQKFWALVGQSLKGAQASRLAP